MCELLVYLGSLVEGELKCEQIKNEKKKNKNPISCKNILALFGLNGCFMGCELYSSFDVLIFLIFILILFYFISLYFI